MYITIFDSIYFSFKTIDNPLLRRIGQATIMIELIGIGNTSVRVNSRYLLSLCLIRGQPTSSKQCSLKDKIIKKLDITRNGSLTSH